MKVTLKHVLRWTIFIFCLLLASLFYGIWKQIELESAGGYNWRSSIMRGAIIFTFIYWAWKTTKGMTDSCKKKRKPKQSDSPQFLFLPGEAPATKPEVNSGTGQE